MEILYPPALIPFLKHKHLLLDTNVFRDALANPGAYNDFFNILEKSDVTLATIDLVKYELLKGSAGNIKYKEREKLIKDITDVVIPTTPNAFQLAYELIQHYGINGASLNITDLFLGATLMQYKRNICLITRDTNDFNKKVFELPFVINATHDKGIFTYGIYQYIK